METNVNEATLALKIILLCGVKHDVMAACGDKLLISNGGINTVFDPCNNPKDLLPYVYKHHISSAYDYEKNVWVSLHKDGSMAEHDNPLRAQAECLVKHLENN